MKHVCLLLLLLLSLLPLFTSCTPETPKEAATPALPPAPPPSAMQQFATALHANPDQLGKVKQIEDQHRPKLESLEKTVSEKQKAFEDALAADQTLNELMPVYQDLDDAKRGLDLGRFTMMMEIRALLSEEQRRKFRMPRE